MSANPYDQAHELARAIKGSDAYQNYVQAKELVEANPEHKEKVLAFRTRQLEINRATIMEEEIAPEMAKAITTEYALLNSTPEIAEFFKAEAVFIQIYNDLQQIIHKVVEESLQ